MGASGGAGVCDIPPSPPSGFFGFSSDEFIEIPGRRPHRAVRCPVVVGNRVNVVTNAMLGVVLMGDGAISKSVCRCADTCNSAI